MCSLVDGIIAAVEKRSKDSKTYLDASSGGVPDHISTFYIVAPSKL